MGTLEQQTVEIRLSKGMVARVCLCHIKLVAGYKWHCTGMGYAARSVWDPVKRRNKEMIYLHRVVAGTPKGLATDHIDGNKMNCVCSNLRVVDQRQNIYNQGLNRRSTTGYRGVSQMKASKSLYRAYIGIGGRQKHIGCFKTPEEAALAYNEKAIELWGAYARLNVVRKPKTDTI